MKSLRVNVSLMIALLLALAACGKSHISVGRGEAEEEFKDCVTLSSKGKHEDAIQCMEMFKARYPKTALGQEAELKIGDAQFAKKDYLLAAESYMAFLQFNPNHPRSDYAHYRAGVAYYKESPRAIDRDQEHLAEAIDELRIVLRRYPTSAYADLSKATLHVALNRVAKRHYYIGRFYFRTGEYLAAIPRFMEVANNFPESGLADVSLYRIIEANIVLHHFEDAREAYSAMQTNFPSSPYVKRAERMMLRAAKKT